MGFLYNADILQKAGFASPPATWDEVTSQATAIKAKGCSNTRCRSAWRRKVG